MDFDELIDEFDAEVEDETTKFNDTTKNSTIDASAALKALKMKDSPPAIPQRESTTLKTTKLKHSSYPKIPALSKPMKKDQGLKYPISGNPPHQVKKMKPKTPLTKQVSQLGKQSFSKMLSSKKVNNKEEELQEQWAGLLAHVDGLSGTDQATYAKLFAVAGINQDLAIKLNDKTLEVMGVRSADHRSAILKGIQDEMDAAGMNDEDEVGLAAMWYAMLLKEGFSPHDAKRYAKGFEAHGIDEQAAIELDDEQLEQGGVTDSYHREKIIAMIDNMLVKHQQGMDQQEVGQQAQEINWDRVTQQEADDVQKEIEHSIEHYNIFQAKLAKVLAGDTPKQRKARAERRKARRLRDMARRKKRADRALRHGQDVYDQNRY